MTRWIGPPPTHCDLCSTKIKSAFVDGATQFGPWANMCLPCHKAKGNGLGVGRGQRYIKTTNFDGYETNITWEKRNE